MKTFAKIISTIFHPAFFAVYATLLMFVLPGFMSLYPYNYKKVITLIILISTFILPLLVILILVNTGKINTTDMFNKKERMLPLFISLTFYVITYVILSNFPGGVPVFFKIFIICSIIIQIIILLITPKYKISIHMSGIGGLIGFFFIFFKTAGIPEIIAEINKFNIGSVHFFSVLIILAGIIASSRLILKAHNIYQVTTGFFTGIIIGLSSFLFYSAL